MSRENYYIILYKHNCPSVRIFDTHITGIGKALAYSSGLSEYAT